MENTIRTNGTESHNSVGLLIGLIIGGLTGFGAMLILAPQSGKRTRFQIRQKSIELQGRATDTFDDLLTLSHFDNREILAGVRENIEDK
jgi:gas vesicle protein